MDRSWLGSAEVEPAHDVVAGSMGTWTITYRTGMLGIDDGGSIRLAWRNVCDSERPQFNNSSGSGYTSVTTTGKVRLNARYDERGHIRPWRRTIQIDAFDGSLQEGDLVIITLGDRTHGGPSIRMQTFRESEHIFKVLVDCFGTGRFEEIETQPFIRVVGGHATRLQVASSSDAIVDNAFGIVVRALDRWGNRSDNYRGTVTFSSSDPGASLPNKYVFSAEDRGAKRIDGIILRTPGIQTISMNDDSGLAATSNPVIVRAEEPKLRLYWGDLHGQTKETIGTGTLDEYFTFARDVAGIDFSGWQGNDFQATKKLWRSVREKTREYNQPGRFVTFLGYEWSGLTPAGGDHNIYYLGDDEEIHRSNHWLVDDRSDEASDRYPLSELWKTFRNRRDVIAVAHVGGRYANLDRSDPDLVPLIEVHSNHGTFEWFLMDALSREMKVGFIAGSDDHTCRPGLAWPSGHFNTRGGYAGVYASDLTREALWNALRSRHCYATTGERIVVWVDADGHMMGDEYETDQLPEIHVRIAGTAPLFEVELQRGIKTIFRHPFSRPRLGGRRLIKIEWSGARVRSRDKTVNWRGGLRLEKGRIVAFSEFAFDYPDQGVRRVSERELEWDSVTGGDPDGVLLEVDSPEDEELTFNSEPASFSLRLRDIAEEPVVIDAAGINQRVTISEISGDPLPRDLEFKYVDNDPAEGMNAYWVRVLQSDGSMAWTSPIYVNHKKQPHASSA